MNAFEIRIIVVLILAVSLLAGGTWTGYHFTRQHYELIQQKEQTASETVLANARQAIIDLTAQRDKALAKEETEHAAREKADTDIRNTLDGGLRNLTATIRANAVSPSVANPTGGLGAGAGASGSGSIQPSRGELDAALTEFNAATDFLIGACQHDSREIVGALAVQPPATNPVSR